MKMRAKRTYRRKNKGKKDGARPGEINSMDPSPAAIEHSHRETVKGIKVGTIMVTYGILNPSKRKSK